MAQDIQVLIKNLQDQINQELATLSIPDHPVSLYDPLKYSLLTEGKRIRPILAIIVGQGFGASIDHLMSAALAIETLHTYTLVHDDIMDNDDMRRGCETVHKKYDPNTAILTGDAISTLAFTLLMQTNSKNLQRIGLEFADAMMEICEGQALDVEFENRIDVTIDEYIDMITKKTARLLAMSCNIGAMIAGCDDYTISELNNFAIKMGQAFQIQDDLLEILSTQDEMGKSLGSDFASGKKTYPMLLTLSQLNSEEKSTFLTFLRNSDNIKEIREAFEKSGSITQAKEKVETLLQEAKDHLNVCPPETKEILVGIINFIHKRKS